MRVFLLLSCLFHLSFASFWVTKSSEKQREISNPIIFVPGDGGSQMEAKLTDAVSPPGYNCDTNKDWHRIWLDVLKMLPGRGTYPCIQHLQSLKFDAVTNTSSNLVGVKTRVPGFGTSAGIEWIDPSWAAVLLGNIGQYAHKLVDGLVEEGYKRDKTIRGAPYDFRFAMSSKPEYFIRLRELIEETYKINGEKKVIIMSHSMGGIYALHFLYQQSLSWKEKHVRRFIPLSTPWAGSSDALHAILSGYTFGSSVLDPLVARDSQRTSETNHLLIPLPHALADGVNLVETPERNYNASDPDVAALLRDVGIDTSLYSYVRGANGDVMSPSPAPPGVETTCVYGVGLATSETLRYGAGEFPDGQPAAPGTGEGDGTVTQRSLEVCRQWGGEVIELEGVSHSGVMTDKESIRRIIDAVFKP